MSNPGLRSSTSSGRNAIPPSAQRTFGRSGIHARASRGQPKILFEPPKRVQDMIDELRRKKMPKHEVSTTVMKFVGPEFSYNESRVADLLCISLKRVRGYIKRANKS